MNPKDNNNNEPSYKLPKPSTPIEPTLTMLRDRESGHRPTNEEAYIESQLVNVIYGYSCGMEHKLDVSEYLVNPDVVLMGVNEHELGNVEELYECADHYLLVFSLWEGGMVTYKFKTVEGEYKLHEFTRGRQSPEDFQFGIGKEERLKDTLTKVRFALGITDEE